MNIRRGFRNMINNLATIFGISKKQVKKMKELYIAPKDPTNNFNFANSRLGNTIFPGTIAKQIAHRRLKKKIAKKSRRRNIWKLHCKTV